MISPYKTMWLLVAFDLPTLSETDRRISNNFRQNLLKMGFNKLQLSLYSYYASTKERADEISRYVQRFVPANGIVSIFFLTDRQFGMTKNFFGGLKADLKAPEQGILLF